jgi:hypothetical protein
MTSSYWINNILLILSIEFKIIYQIFKIILQEIMSMNLKMPINIQLIKKIPNNLKMKKKKTQMNQKKNQIIFMNSFKIVIKKNLKIEEPLDKL